MVSLDSKLSQIADNNYQQPERYENKLDELESMLIQMEATINPETGGRRYTLKGCDGNVDLKKIIACVEGVFKEEGKKLSGKKAQNILGQVIRLDALGSYHAAQKPALAWRRTWAQRLGNLFSTKQDRLVALSQLITERKEFDPRTANKQNLLLDVRRLGGKNKDTSDLEDFIKAPVGEKRDAIIVDIIGTPQEKIARALLKDPATPKDERLKKDLERIGRAGYQQREFLKEIDEEEFSPNAFDRSKELFESHVSKAFLEKSCQIGRLSEKPSLIKYRELIADQIAQQIHPEIGKLHLRDYSSRMPSLNARCEKAIAWAEEPKEGEFLNQVEKDFLIKTAHELIEDGIIDDKADSKEQYDDEISLFAYFLKSEIDLERQKYGLENHENDSREFLIYLTPQQLQDLEDYAPDG